MTSAPVAAPAAAEPPKTISQASLDPSSDQASAARDSFAALLGRAGDRKPVDTPGQPSVRPVDGPRARQKPKEFNPGAARETYGRARHAHSDTLSPDSDQSASLNAGTAALIARIAPAGARLEPSDTTEATPASPVRPPWPAIAKPPDTDSPPGEPAIQLPTAPQKDEIAQLVDAAYAIKIVGGGLNAQSGTGNVVTPLSASRFATLAGTNAAPTTLSGPVAATIIGAQLVATAAPHQIAVTAVVEQAHRSQTALLTFGAPVDNARTHDRSVAMERSTTSSSGAGTVASDSTTRAALGEGQDPHFGGSGERRSPSDAERGLTTSGIAASRTAPANHASPVDAPPLNLQDRIRVVDQVAQRLETMRITTGRQEVTLHLRPDHLGDLRVTIVTQRDQVHAHVIADSTGVRQAVEDGRDRLRQVLELRGYSLQGLDVSLNQGSRQGFPAFTQPLINPSSQTSHIETSASDSTAVSTEAVASSGRQDGGRLDCRA